MKQIVDWFSDQLNLTTILAIASFVASSYTLIQGALSKRKRLAIRILALDTCRSTMFLTMSFENLSQLPIAITNIRYISGREKFNCTPIPAKVADKTVCRNQEVLSHKEFFSERLPIQLSPLGAVSCLVLFENLRESPETDAKSLTFQVCTNRGKPVQKTLALSEDVLYQQRVY